MKRLIDGEKYNRALTSCSIPGENGIFERGFNAGLNVAWNLLSVMPDELPEMKATVTVASHEPAVFGEWYKPEEKNPETGKDVLVELENDHGVMAVWHYNEVSKAWFEAVSGIKRSAPIARWCYLPEGLPF